VALVNTAVIVPPVVCHNLDVHTGIPFMPHMAAHLAAMLLHDRVGVHVIDCFGLQPNHRRVVREFMLMGADVDGVPARLPAETTVAFIYCRTIAEFVAVELIVAALQRDRSDVRIVLFENVQAVTSYSLRHVADEFLGKGVDAVVLGEPERRAAAVAEALTNGRSLSEVPGLVYREGDRIIRTGDAVLEHAALLRRSHRGARVARRVGVREALRSGAPSDQAFSAATLHEGDCLAADARGCRA
jgi:anaerobic magnesium-protoporphyrin IX monomethyl ester cyclase